MRKSAKDENLTAGACTRAKVANNSDDHGKVLRLLVTEHMPPCTKAPVTKALALSLDPLGL